MFLKQNVELLETDEYLMFQDEYFADEAGYQFAKTVCPQ